MFADLGAKVIGPPFVNNLKGWVLWIDFHFTHRIDFKLLPDRIISMHIETVHNFPDTPVGAPHDEHERIFDSFCVPQ
jgi:hypothetical protein